MFCIVTIEHRDLLPALEKASVNASKPSRSLSAARYLQDAASVTAPTSWLVCFLLFVRRWKENKSPTITLTIKALYATQPGRLF